MYKNYHFEAQLAQAMRDNLWVLQIKNEIEHVYNDFLEIKIPFNDLRINEGDEVEFFIIQGPMGILDDFCPQNSLLPVVRPVKVVNK